VPHDAAQGRSEPISTETVQEEVGGKRDVEEQVTDGLRHLCVQSQCNSASDSYTIHTVMIYFQ